MVSVADTVSAVHETDWARIVAGLIRVTRDWALAEDAAGDAFAAALQRWPVDGVPSNPAAWVSTVARNRAIDLLRRNISERSKLAGLAQMDVASEPPEDDRLRLIFTCCHPALDLPAQVALTLRTVAGLPVADIATAFLVPETTMGQRLVRARRKIANAGIPYRVPPPESLGGHLTGVLAVIYLVFNQGYSAVADTALATTGISLAAQLASLMPAEPEARGLHALLLLQHSRREARRGPDGELRTLEEQDRTRWNHQEIACAASELRAALDHARADGKARAAGPYVLQAAIAQCHAVAARAGATNWRRIVALYDELLQVAPSPIVELNRAIAVGMRDGSQAGLALLDDLAPKLPGYRLLPAAQADLLVRCGQVSAAVRRYREALALTESAAERAQIQRRLTALEALN